MEGPFQGIEGVFEKYLNSAERVAVLLNCVHGGSLRVVVSTTTLTPADSCQRVYSCGNALSSYLQREVGGAERNRLHE
jgi:hypothetical protein